MVIHFLLLLPFSSLTNDSYPNLNVLQQAYRSCLAYLLEDIKFGYTSVEDKVEDQGPLQQTSLMNATSEPGWAGTNYNSQPSWDSELSTKLFCQLIMKVCETSIGQKTNYTGTANYQPVIGTSIRSTYSIRILFISPLT